MMNSDIEQRLRKIIEVSTKKAAISEWIEAATTQKVPLYNYRMDHVEEVVVLAKHIAEGSNANMEVITLAAWLHDIAKPGIRGIHKQHHGIVSAEIAEEILTQEKIEYKIIENVSDVIKKHVGLTLEKPLEPLEAQILWESDKILKIGIIGLLQYILNNVRITPGRNLHEIAEKLREFLPLAGDIASSVATAKGKEIAEERLKNLHQLADMLDSELRRL